jgi:hypothetical protein
MAARFHEDGIGFQYPENWHLAREEGENGWTATVQSPDTAFFMLTFDAEMPEVDLMADTALEALRSEYAGLEADPALESLAGQPAVGYDVRFFSFDLTNTCWLRCFYTERGTVLAMWQASDLDLDHVGPVLRAVCASLTVDEA